MATNKQAMDWEMSENDVKGIHKQVKVGGCKVWKLPQNNRINACRVSEEEVTAEHYVGKELIASFRHKAGEKVERIEPGEK